MTKKTEADFVFVPSNEPPSRGFEVLPSEAQPDPEGDAWYKALAENMAAETPNFNQIDAPSSAPSPWQKAVQEYWDSVNIVVPSHIIEAFFEINGGKNQAIIPCQNRRQAMTSRLRADRYKVKLLKHARESKAIPGEAVVGVNEVVTTVLEMNGGFVVVLTSITGQAPAEIDQEMRAKMLERM